VQYHSLFRPLNPVTGWPPSSFAHRRPEEHLVSLCLICLI
jgi:hypothetical protein